MIPKKQPWIFHLDNRLKFNQFYHVIEDNHKQDFESLFLRIVFNKLFFHGKSNTGHDMYAIETYGSWLKEITNDEYGLFEEISLEECKNIVKCLITDGRVPKFKISLI